MNKSDQPTKFQISLVVVHITFNPKRVTVEKAPVDTEAIKQTWML